MLKLKILSTALPVVVLQDKTAKIPGPNARSGQWIDNGVHVNSFLIALLHVSISTYLRSRGGIRSEDPHLIGDMVFSLYVSCTMKWRLINNNQKSQIDTL